MKKLNLAIIGQGRSGKDIHGVYYNSERNKYYNVKYVVDMDEFRRGVAEKIYPGCQTFASYQELFDKKDIDLVVNSTYSEMHYPITKDLLSHGFNVLVEKPFARNQFECEDLIKTAKDNGVLLAVFQNTFFAPYYLHVLKLLQEQKFGKVEQISIRFNNFARRWDWQTLQCKLAGNVYNTGPHPIGLALGFLGFDDGAKVVYSKLANTTLSSGDSDDYAKILIEAPNKPLIDLEINSTDAFSAYNIKIQSEKGTFKCTPRKYEWKYIIDGENEPRPLIRESLKDADGNPIYCGENKIVHEETGEYKETAFDAGTAGIYEEVYYALTEGKPLTVSAEKVTKIVGVMEMVHAQNPLPVKYN